VSIFSSHVPFRRLADLVEGRLRPDEQAQVQRHVAGCPRCAAEVAWLESVLELMRGDASEDAPPPVITRAVRLFRPIARQAPECHRGQAVPEPRRRVAAVMQFDSARLPLMAGVRGEPMGPRQLLFSAEEYELDLRIAPAGEAWIVSGQVLGPAAAGQVELQSETESQQVPLSELSEFALPPVLAGSYALLLYLADVEVEVGKLEVGV
jgi:anti-sigma factor RsiW